MIRQQFLLFSSLVLFLVYLNGCSTPEAGDLGQSDIISSEMEKLISNKTIITEARSVSVDMRSLNNWKTQTLTIPQSKYKEFLESGKLVDQYSGLGSSCERNLETPWAYTIYNTKHKALVRENNRLLLSEGVCRKMTHASLGIQVVLGTYAFTEPFSIQVPSPETQLGSFAILGERVSSLWGFSMGLGVMRTDLLISKKDGMNIGEATGYLHHGVNFFHSVLFEAKDNNYYRLILVGKQTFVVIDAKAPLTMSLHEIQKEILPILNALYYSTASRK